MRSLARHPRTRAASALPIRAAVGTGLFDRGVIACAIVACPCGGIDGKGIGIRTSVGGGIGTVVRGAPDGVLASVNGQRIVCVP